MAGSDGNKWNARFATRIVKLVQPPPSATVVYRNQCHDMIRYQADSWKETASHPSMRNSTLEIVRFYPNSGRQEA